MSKDIHPFKKIIMFEKLEQQFFSKHDQSILSRIRNSMIGIAGAGGLGSNIAFSLARAGIGKLIISDFDNIEITNLNRQQYFFHQIGTSKVEALKENLENINPFSTYEIHKAKINPENAIEIYKEVDILIEAFDKAEMKKMLIESWLSVFPQKPIIVGSGLAGYGHNELLHSRNIDNLYICGDEVTDIQVGISPMAPRVGIVANMQANLALEILLKDNFK